MKINDLLTNLTLDEKVNLLLGNSNYTNHLINNLTINNFNIKSLNKLVDKKINKMSNCFDVDLLANFIQNEIKGVSSNTILDLDLIFSFDKNVNSIFVNKMLRVLCQNFFVVYRTNVFTNTYDEVKNVLYFAEENLAQFRGKRVFSSASNVAEVFRKINEGAMFVFLEDDSIRDEVIEKVSEYVKYYNDFNRKEITEETYKNYLDSLGSSYLNVDVINDRLSIFFEFLQDFDQFESHFYLDNDEEKRLEQSLALNNQVLLKNDKVLPLKNENVVTLNFKDTLENINVVEEINNLPFNDPINTISQTVDRMMTSFDVVIIRLDVLNEAINEDKINIVKYFKSINKKVIGVIDGGYIAELDETIFDAIIFRNYKNSLSDLMLSQLLLNEEPFNAYLTCEMLNHPYGYGLSLGEIKVDNFKKAVKDYSVVLRNKTKYDSACLVLLYSNNNLEDFKTVKVKHDSGEKVYLSLINALNTNRNNQIDLRTDAYSSLFKTVVEKTKEKNMNDNVVVGEFIDNLIIEENPDQKVKKINKFKYLIFILVFALLAVVGAYFVDALILPQYAEVINLVIYGLAGVLSFICLIKFFKSGKNKLGKYDVNKALQNYTYFKTNEVITPEEPVYEEPEVVETEEVKEIKKEITYDYKEELSHEVNSIKFENFFPEFYSYLEKHNIYVDKTVLIDLLSSMTMSRLIFVEGKSEEINVLLHALFNFFDNEYNITNISDAQTIYNLYETSDSISPLLKTMLAAKENKEKIYMSFITGLNVSNSNLFKTNLLDLDSKHNTYNIDLGINKVVNLPKNLWYFVASDNYYNLDLTKSSCTIRLNNINYDNALFDLSEKPIDVILYNREISDIKEKYYLNEEDYKKLDVFYQKLEDLTNVKLSNKDLISIENFISCYKVFNDNDTEIIDKLILVRFVPFIKTICLEKNIKFEIISTLNNLFGENILLRTIKSLNE